MLWLEAEGAPLAGAIAPGTTRSDMVEAGGTHETDERVANLLVSRSGSPSNTVRVRHALRAAGVTQELQVYECVPHARSLSDPTSVLSKEAFRGCALFFDRHPAK